MKHIQFSEIRKIVTPQIYPENYFFFYEEREIHCILIKSEDKTKNFVLFQISQKIYFICKSKNCL